MINRHTLNKQIKKMSRMFKMIGIQNVLKKITSKEEEPRSTFVSYTNRNQLQPSYSLDEGLSGSKIIYFAFH